MTVKNTENEQAKPNEKTEDKEDGLVHKALEFITTELEEQTLIEVPVFFRRIVPVLFLPNVMGSKLTGVGEDATIVDIKFTADEIEKFKSIDSDANTAAAADDTYRTLLGWNKITEIYREYLLEIETALNDFSQKNSAEERLRAVIPKVIDLSEITDFNPKIWPPDEVAPVNQFVNFEPVKNSSFESAMPLSGLWRYEFDGVEISETAEDLMKKTNIQFQIWTVGYNWEKSIKDFSDKIIECITNTIQGYYKDTSLLHKSALDGDNVKVLLMSYGFSNVITDYLTTGVREYYPEMTLAEEDKKRIIGQIYLNKYQRWKWDNFIPADASCNTVEKGKNCKCEHELWFQNIFPPATHVGEFKVKGLKGTRNFTRALANLRTLHKHTHAMDMPDYFKTSMDMLKKLRESHGPITINSGHRCFKHNANVSTSNTSEHLWLAFDCSITKGHAEFAKLAYKFGFRGFGFSGTFVHIDNRRYAPYSCDEKVMIWPYNDSYQIKEISKFVKYLDGKNISWEGATVAWLLAEEKKKDVEGN